LLLRVRNHDAVVAAIQHAIVIIVGVARVALCVTIGIGL
jgi:hypothetical protein